MWYIHTKEYYSTLKKSEILSFVTTWKSLVDIVLSEAFWLKKKKAIFHPSWGLLFFFPPVVN
jgi:hypothetical protein